MYPRHLHMLNLRDRVLNLRDLCVGFKTLVCCSRETHMLPLSCLQAHATLHLSCAVATHYSYLPFYVCAVDMARSIYTLWHITGQYWVKQYKLDLNVVH